MTERRRATDDYIRPERAASHMSVRFVTGNEGKSKKPASISGIEPVEQVEYDYTEIQSDSLEEIAARGAGGLRGRRRGEPVLVGDAGCSSTPSTAFRGRTRRTSRTVGVERLWRLVREENRRARFRTVLAFADGSRRRRSRARSPARSSPRGEGGFGYDPIFEYNGQTLAEMSTEEKTRSPPGRALSTFAEWYADQH
ncbi:non-canonical purine NTP pyrophosphatase [Natrialba swarupiae]|nr:non-canonical purine NTP pyrophosphatase [Natrialba swarupiae]